MPNCARITPHALWKLHRAAAGGASTITKAALPNVLDECPLGPQETHYFMAVAIAATHDDAGDMPVPRAVREGDPARAEELRRLATEEGLALKKRAEDADHGFYG
jgi:hypothetical protein